MTTYTDAEEAGDPPFELYRFVRGTTTWTYTSGDTPRRFNNETYFPAAITRTALNNTDEASTDTIQIVIPRDLPVAAQFVSGPPPAPVWLTIYRSHRTDVTAVGTLITGEISTGAFDAASVTLTCEGLTSTLTRSIPRVLYQSVCNNSLYDGRCQVVKADFTVADTVESLNGLAVTVTHAADKADGYYAGGIIEQGEANGFIESHVGNVLTLMYPIEGLAGGDAISILPGCDKLNTTCKNKFNNIVHFQGFPYIPIVNPFIDGVS